VFLQTILLLLGFIVLIKSADWLVDGAAALAKKYNVSDLAIGLTIVAFGTSAPELVVNTIAAFQAHHDIVFGNVIGSNNFNLFIILGIAGLITPLVVQSSTVWKEIPLSLIAAITVLVMANDLYFSNSNIISRLEGVILLVLFALFLFYVYKQMRGNNAEIPDSVHKPLPPLKIWGFIIIGLAGLVIGGQLVVKNAVNLATALGISQKIIGLTIVALGTSLPELATSVVAAFKKNNDIAVGNIIGSNIFNLFLILGISSLIRPIEYNQNFNLDLGILVLGTTFLFVAMFTGRKRKLDRWEAGILLIAYIAYTGWLILKEA
jgi:cation:H+ antiporter